MNLHHFLTDSEKQLIAESAEAQERIVLKIMRNHPSRSTAYFEIMQATNWDKDSVKRSLSDLSGSNKDWRDEYGRYPLEYDSEERKKNPDTGHTCGTYKVNCDYGEPKPLAGEQTDAFGPPKPQNKGPYAI